jgi:hypothetical protein
MPHQHEITSEMRQCIQDCLDCARICTETVNHCLMLGGRYAEASHVRTLMDCAASCAQSAGFMLRNSQYYSRMCDVCSEICRSCAESCERAGRDDDTMMRCADLCRRTAESCRRMAMAVA